MSLRGLSSTVFFRAPIKILNKNDQKLKAKPWITKNIRVSIKKIIFKSAIKDKTKKFSTTFKNIEINLKELLSVLKDFELNQTVLSCGKLSIILLLLGLPLIQILMVCLM